MSTLKRKFTRSWSEFQNSKFDLRLYKSNSRNTRILVTVWAIPRNKQNMDSVLYTRGVKNTRVRETVFEAVNQGL